MSALDLDGLVELAERAARAGGEIVREAFGSPPPASSKGPGDWVSEIDHRSEDRIREILTTAAPDITFFGEETGGARGPVGWLVDPLDGTANYLRRFPVVGVSIGLVEHGRPVGAVVYAPMLDEIYIARLGSGTTRDGFPLHIGTRSIEAAVVATGFPFRAKRECLGEYMPVFNRALVTYEDLRRAGAASLDLAWSASGTFDGYFEQGLGPWDVAAGALLVREAGGVVTDWQGHADAWLDSGDIVAGSPHVHARLLELIVEARADG